MNKQNLLGLIVFLFTNCHSQDCPKNINQLPMYGKIEKCQEQINSDIKFINEIDKSFKSRVEAAKEHTKLAWEYFYKQDYETSMKRFNQAWLIDSTYYESYWGFANIIGIKGNPTEALTYFELAKKYNPSSANFHLSMASAQSHIYQSNKDQKLLDDIIKELKTGLALDSINGKIYEMLAISYFYKKDIVEAKKHLQKAENIQDFSVNNEFKRMLESIK
ncbi:MAG: tetratricopeptide repeat protein [Sphingobacterium composti]|uniref:tetratricopeptide repeat protein n=1 Tax=Sphingobacterium composti TaxID=363260 RepID=UPI0013579DCE|nr:hypothetical protein [Sphingobacterium composti Ten et al. 2007 non Yoo et al. 2007]